MLSVARSVFSLARRLFSVAFSRLRRIRDFSEAPACARVDFGSRGEKSGGEGLLMELPLLMLKQLTLLRAHTVSNCLPTGRDTQHLAGLSEIHRAPRCALDV